MTAAMRAYTRCAAASSDRSMNSGIDRWDVMGSKETSTHSTPSSPPGESGRPSHLVGAVTCEVKK